MSLQHNGKYRIRNSLDLIHDLGIPESHDMVALTFELARSFGIIPPGRVFRVLAAIKLANETDLTTGEISEIAADRNLPPKMRALDRDAPQVFPEPGFSISRARAQAAAVGNLEAIELGGLLRRKDLRALKRQIDALR